MEEEEGKRRRSRGGGGAAGRGPSRAQGSPRARRAQPRLCSPRQPSVRAFSTAAPDITSCRRAIGRAAPRVLAARARGRREGREAGGSRRRGAQGWWELVGEAGGRRHEREGGGRARGLEFLSHEQFPAILRKGKLNPLPAISILRRRSRKVLEEFSFLSPHGPGPSPRAPAGEAWEDRPGTELQEPLAASHRVRPSALASRRGHRAAAQASGDPAEPGRLEPTGVVTPREQASQHSSLQAS